MNDKPSLYVVEKKEVIILVALFVLVTVLAFTIGVKYGESIGKKATHEEQLVSKEHSEELGEGHGGSLGAEKSPEHLVAAKEEHGAEHGAEKAESAHADAHSAHEEHKAEGEKHDEKAAAPVENKDAKKKTSADHNSDEYLLNALKDSGVQAPSDKEELPATKLPTSTKQPKAGVFVIQIGSFPTKKDAEQQAKVYREKKLDVSILAPIKDKQGEWFRVCVGSYGNRENAERDAKHLKDKALIHSYFVRRVN